MFKFLSANKYEKDYILRNYILSQYGPFLKKPYYGSESFYQKIIEESVPYINNESEILDAGCATGRLVFEYEKLGAKRSIGIDTSKKFIKFCNFKKMEMDSGAEFVCANILKSGLQDASFDFISCLNVIDRVPDPQMMINKLHSLLKQNSALLLVDPYDWEFSPAPKEFHVNDMNLLLDPNMWTIKKEIQNIKYTIPVDGHNNREYICHLVIAQKIFLNS